ncbi:hypothetical protein SEA_KAMRYN_262 [Mycobacterium phage Kamryn]|nr:hypothetical protein SEA_KAMRYN_262 [Mycobacterium phage Kamryn]
MSSDWAGVVPQYGLQRTSTYTPGKGAWGVTVDTTYLMNPDQARAMAHDLLDLAALADLRNDSGDDDDDKGSSLIEDGWVVKNRFGKVTEE